VRSASGLTDGEFDSVVVSDDEPAPVREWLPVLANALGAKPPRRFPVWLARNRPYRQPCRSERLRAHSRLELDSDAEGVPERCFGRTGKIDYPAKEEPVMSETPELPQPDPALRRLDRLVGRWSMEGHLVGSDETNDES
jgi:hypothetical protein